MISFNYKGFAKEIVSSLLYCGQECHEFLFIGREGLIVGAQSLAHIGNRMFTLHSTVPRPLSLTSVFRIND
jgi:hypothetical protein